MPAVEAAFEGGVLDGAIRTIELNTDGSPPHTITVPQTGLYIGTSDIPAPPTYHHYRHVHDPTDDDYKLV